MVWVRGLAPWACVVGPDHGCASRALYLVLAAVASAGRGVAAGGSPTPLGIDGAENLGTGGVDKLKN